EPQVEGALAAIDPYTGQVKAMVGGYDFRRSQFNRAVQAKRQPGSAFKPLVYACAIDHGYTPASIVLDAPIVLPDGNRPPWMPRNYENKYYGPTPLRSALARSLNTVTVRLVDQMGLREVLASLPRFGLQGRLPPNLSIALGSMEVTPLELARAYGVFATLGKQETGGHAAAPIWTAFMKKAVADRPVIDFPVPEGVTFAQIDRATGLRAAAGQESELEVFVKGSEPTQYTAAPEELPANPE